MVPPTSKHCKLVDQRNLEKNNQLDISSNNTNNSKNINTLEDTTKFIEKKCLETFHICPKPTQLKMFHKSLNAVVSKTQTIECEKKAYIENLLYKYHIVVV